MAPFIADTFNERPPPRRINARLAELRDRLRDQASFENFAWNFDYILTSCKSSGCALGLAATTMPDFPLMTCILRRGFRTLVVPNGQQSRQIAEYFGISESIYHSLFLSGSFYRYRDRLATGYVGEVAPGDVADAIDYYDEHGSLRGFQRRSQPA